MLAISVRPVDETDQYCTAALHVQALTDVQLAGVEKSLTRTAKQSRIHLTAGAIWWERPP